jgi:hypothetical protein
MVRTKTRKRGIKKFALEGKAGRIADRLRQHYRLGQEANASDLPAKDLADTRGVSEHLMRKFKRFAGEYTPRDLEALCNALRPNGLPLQWGHVNYLLGIHDKQERKAMQRRAIENGWTAPQLARAITKSHRTKSGHGRPMMPPATPEAGLEQLMAEAQMWIRRCEVVMVAVQRGPEKRLGQELRRRAKDAVEVLEEMQRTVQRAKRELGAMLPSRSVG